MARTTTGHEVCFKTEHMIKKDNVKLQSCTENYNRSKKRALGPVLYVKVIL